MASLPGTDVTGLMITDIHCVTPKTGLCSKTTAEEVELLRDLFDTKPEAEINWGCPLPKDLLRVLANVVLRSLDLENVELTPCQFEEVLLSIRGQKVEKLVIKVPNSLCLKTFDKLARNQKWRLIRLQFPASMGKEEVAQKPQFAIRKALRNGRIKTMRLVFGKKSANRLFKRVGGKMVL